MPKLIGMDWTTGVYCWRHLASNKVYVGSTTRSFDKRLKEYETAFRHGKCHNRYLQRAWDKYGEAAFRWEIVEPCPVEECESRETWWIAKLDATNPDKGYNVCKEGTNCQGTKRSPETVARISASKTGTKHSAETREKMSAKRRGRKNTPQALANLKAHHWSKGPDAEAIKADMREKRRLQVITEEAKVKMSAAKVGKKLDEAHKASISEAVKKQWERRRAMKKAKKVLPNEIIPLPPEQSGD